jgi:hypothetical protein
MATYQSLVRYLNLQCGACAKASTFAVNAMLANLPRSPNLLDTDIVASINYKGGNARFQDRTIKPCESGANCVSLVLAKISGLTHTCSH